MVINKFPNREVYEKIKAKGSLGANDVNVLEDYPGPELTEADKSEIAGKVTADGMEFTLSDFPTALKNPQALTFTGAATGTYDGSAALTINIPAGGSSGSGSGGALKAMSAVAGYIGIPAADLPENGIVWMCIADGATNQEYYSGTITMQGGALSSNNMVSISSNGVIQLNWVAQVSDGIAIYGMSAVNYTGVYQVAGAGGSAEATQKAWAKIIDAEITEATVSFSKEGLPNVTELYIKGSQLANATDKDSTEWLAINNKFVSQNIAKVVKVGVPKVFNWTYCKYNGLVWVIYSSSGAIYNDNISTNNVQYPYNLVDNVGAATSIKISSPTIQYAANTGKLEVWAR